MIDYFEALPPYLQALIATLFTWFVTALGASLVFFFKTFNQRLLDGMLGFAAGVMVAASFWSLLAPGIEFAEEVSSLPPYFVAMFGFLLGGFFIYLIDYFLPHIHMDYRNKKEGISSNWRRSLLLVIAMTIHNIPEGLAVGVAFGSLGYHSFYTLGSAVALAIGIGIQNFPEGLSVSAPLHAEGVSRKKAFMYGQLSGIVEPIAGVLGAMMVYHMIGVLPYALCFAAGAMIYVVVKELIPGANLNQNGSIVTLFFMLGFSVMMVLDVALG